MLHLLDNFCFFFYCLISHLYIIIGTLLIAFCLFHMLSRPRSYHIRISCPSSLALFVFIFFNPVVLTGFIVVIKCWCPFLATLLSFLPLPLVLPSPFLLPLFPALTPLMQAECDQFLENMSSYERAPLDLMKRLWENPQIQQAYDQRNRFQLHDSTE